MAAKSSTEMKVYSENIHRIFLILFIYICAQPYLFSESETRAQVKFILAASFKLLFLSSDATEPSFNMYRLQRITLECYCRSRNYCFMSLYIAYSIAEFYWRRQFPWLPYPSIRVFRFQILRLMPIVTKKNNSLNWLKIVKVVLLYCSKWEAH